MAETIIDTQPDLTSEFLKERDEAFLKNLNERLRKIESTEAAKQTNFGNKYIDARFNNIINVSVCGNKKHIHIEPNTIDLNHDIDINVDEIVLCDKSEASVRDSSMKVSNVSFTVATDQGVGVNKLDEGVLAINTWYYIWVIAQREVIYDNNYNPVSGLGCLISTSEDNPTLPGGYTFKGRVGVFHTDAGANIIWFTQTDNQWWVKDDIIFINAATETVFTARSLVNINPPHAQTVMVTFRIERVTAAILMYWKIDDVPNGAGGHAVGYARNSNQEVWSPTIVNVNHDNELFTRMNIAGGRQYGYYNGCFLPI